SGLHLIVRRYNTPRYCPTPLWPAPTLRRQHLHHVPVRIAEIEPAPAAPMIDLHVVERARPAAIGDAFLLHPRENPVERALVDLERVVMAFERGIVVEIERQRFVDLERREMRNRALIREAQD